MLFELAVPDAGRLQEACLKGLVHVAICQMDQTIIHKHHGGV